MSISKALAELRSVTLRFEDRVIPALELTVALLMRSNQNADLKPIIDKLAAERTAIVELVNRIIDHVAVESAEIEIANLRDMEIEASLRLSQATAKAELTAKADPLANFVAINLHQYPGRLLPFGEFYAKFLDSLPAGQQKEWSTVKVSRSLPRQFRSGPYNQNRTYIINASWEPMPDNETVHHVYTIRNGRIVKLE